MSHLGGCALTRQLESVARHMPPNLFPYLAHVPEKAVTPAHSTEEWDQVVSGAALKRSGLRSGRSRALTAAFLVLLCPVVGRSRGDKSIDRDVFEEPTGVAGRHDFSTELCGGNTRCGSSNQYGNADRVDQKTSRALVKGTPQRRIGLLPMKDAALTYDTTSRRACALAAKSLQASRMPLRVCAPRS